MSTTMQNPEALLSVAAREEQETPLSPPPPLLHSAATTFEPPYVRIVPRFYSFETVPTRLQDTVSMSAWQSLGRTVRPVLRRNEQLDKCLTWICFLFWMTYVVLLIVDPWAVIARNENWPLAMGTIVLALVGFLTMQSLVQKWQQRALETACRSAEQTTFRSLGWALDGCYNGGLVCCRIPSVIYFSPLDIRNENHWYESEHAAISPFVFLPNGYRTVQTLVQNWQQRALETACRSAEQTTFRSLGWALDGCYNGGLVCCRIPTVLYFSPLNIRNDNHWYESEHAAIAPPVLTDDTRDLEDSLARRGYLRIPLVQYGYQWSSISLSRLEAFATLPKGLQPRQEHMWTTFIPK
jgi:hypothetical protein